MNDEICYRCNEMPATLLIDHAGYGEPVCKECRDDEDRYEIAQNEFLRAAEEYEAEINRAISEIDDILAPYENADEF